MWSNLFLGVVSMDAAAARTADRRNSSRFQRDRSWIDHLAADSLILLGVVFPLPLLNFFHGFPVFSETVPILFERRRRRQKNRQLSFAQFLLRQQESLDTSPSKWYNLLINGKYSIKRSNDGVKS